MKRQAAITALENDKLLQTLTNVTPLPIFWQFEPKGYEDSLIVSI